MTAISKNPPRTQPLYLLSGLGADERVFEHFRPEGIRTQLIQWEPVQPGQSLRSYAKALSKQITKPGPIHLLGVSFGGILAQEIAQLRDCQRVFLVSTVKSSQEMSFPLQLVRKTRLYRLPPTSLLQWAGQWAGPVAFGVQKSAEKELLRSVIADTDPSFLRWAIGQIMQWQGGYVLPQLRHIHGSKDRLFPISSIRGCSTIPGSGHWMIYQQAAQVADWVLQHWED